MESIIENRHVFLAITICMVLLSPLVILMVPVFVAQTFFYERGYWLINAPSVNYILYAIGLALLIIACVILWLKDINKFSIVSAISLSVACFVLLFGASLSYEKITSSAVTLSGPFSSNEKIYSWEEVEKVDYFLHKEHAEGRYFIFYFSDGATWTLEQSGYVSSEVRSNIERKLSELEIPFDLNFL